MNQEKKENAKSGNLEIFPNAKEKYFYIEPKKAKELISQTKDMKPSKIGSSTLVYLIDEYAILETEEINRRNVLTHDDDLVYLDELIETLMDLSKKDISTVPILGYCLDLDSKEGNGYVIQARAKGAELYDDEVMKDFYTGWKQNNSEAQNFKSSVDSKEYILSRTTQMAKVPQEHFNKFIKDIIALLELDILVDFKGKSNFFYDDTVGFQFIDLISHTDYKYGLEKEKVDSKEKASSFGFVPCHFAPGTKVLPLFALKEEAISILSDEEHEQLAQDNKLLFDKCKTAMLNNGISEEQIEKSLQEIKLFS